MQGINAAIDSRSGRPIAYKLPKQPEFLFSEEAAVHRRSWSENLTFYTGGGYLSGTALQAGQHSRNLNTVSYIRLALQALSWCRAIVQARCWAGQKA